MNNVMGLVALPLLLLLPLLYVASIAPTATAVAKHTNIFFADAKCGSLDYMFGFSFFVLSSVENMQKLVDRQEFAERPNNKFVRAPIIFVYDFKLCVFVLQT